MDQKAHAAGQVRRNLGREGTSRSATWQHCRLERVPRPSDDMWRNMGCIGELYLKLMTRVSKVMTMGSMIQIVVQEICKGRGCCKHGGCAKGIRLPGYVWDARR